MPNDALMLIGMAEAQQTGGVPQFTQRHRMALALEFAGLTREDMAAELDVHRNTIGNWMKGTKPVPRAAMIAWAFRTGVPFEWLLTGHVTENGGPDEGSGRFRCIRGPWLLDATAEEVAA